MKAHSSQQQLRSASIPMSSSFLQMICLVVILMNVLTAFAGMHYEDHFQRLPLHPSENDDPSIDAAQHSHRALQSSTIDYSGCYMDLTNADRDKNGFIEQQEYYTFLQSYGKRVCSTSTTVSLQQKSTFYTLACLCKQMDSTTGALSDQKVTSSDQCCLGNNAKLQTARDPITMAPVPIPQLTVPQKEYVKTVCFYTDASIPASVRDCGSDTEEDNDDGEDFPVDGDNTTSSHSSGNQTNTTTVVDNDDSEEDSGDDDYGDEMNDGEDDHKKPKGTAACRLKSLNILENGELTLRHYSDPIEESITVQLIYNSGVGWLGFGFTDVTKEANMIHNFAVIGLPDTRKVQQYDLTGRSITGVTPTPVQSLIRSTITQNGDQTVLTFTQAASEIGNIYNGTFQFIYAVGRNNELAYHTYRGSGYASFSVCDVIYSNETETNDDATELNINATATTSNTTETDDDTDDTEPESEVESMTPSSSPTSSSIVSIVTSTSQVPSMSPTSLDNNNDDDDDDDNAMSPSMAPSGGKATTSLTTQPPYLRGTSAPSTMTSTKAPKVEDEGSTAKDIIEAFLNGKKGTDGTDSSSPPPSPTAGEGQGTKNNTDETDNSAGMASFIRWLRTIWQFSKQPFISADKKDDR